MNIKLIFAIILIILLVGCKKEVPTEAGITEEISHGEAPSEIPVDEKPSEILIETAVVEIKLTVDKKMEPDELSVPIGAIVKWTNEGKLARNLMIYDASIKDLKDEDVVRSQNILTGESFNYTFDKKGEYVVKDIYTYAIRGKITAKVVNSIGEELGRVVVK